MLRPVADVHHAADDLVWRVVLESRVLDEDLHGVAGGKHVIGPRSPYRQFAGLHRQALHPRRHARDRRALLPVLDEIPVPGIVRNRKARTGGNPRRRHPVPGLDMHRQGGQHPHRACVNAHRAREVGGGSRSLGVGKAPRLDKRAWPVRKYLQIRRISRRCVHHHFRSRRKRHVLARTARTEPLPHQVVLHLQSLDLRQSVREREHLAQVVAARTVLGRARAEEGVDESDVVASQGRLQQVKPVLHRRRMAVDPLAVDPCAAVVRIAPFAVPPVGRRK